MTIRVLYLSSAPKIGGSTKSLSEAFKAFPDGAVEGVIICPKGEVTDVYSSIGMTVISVPGISRWNETDHGYYRGLRWGILLREIYYFPFTIWGVLKARRMARFDIIHANDVDLAYVGGIAKRLLHAPLLVHVRCVLRKFDASARTKHLNKFLRVGADRVISIDQTVRRTLGNDVVSDIIHNGLNVDRSVNCDRNSETGPLRIAFVGGFTLMKGILEFAEAAKLCRDRGMNVQFVAAGENARAAKGVLGRLLSLANLSHDVAGELAAMIERYDLQGTLLLKGFIRNVSSIYANVDVLCFASHLDAPGRPVFEAAYFEVPSIVAVRCPTADTIVPGETGICISKADPVLIADAIEFLYKNPEERRRMGRNARKLAETNFDIRANAARLLEIYREMAFKAAKKLAAKS